MGDTKIGKRDKAWCYCCNGLCCLAIVFVLIVAIVGLVRVMFAKGHAVPVPPPDETRVGLRINVAHASNFARHLREDKGLQARLRSSVAKAQGVSEHLLGIPTVTIEGANQHTSFEKPGTHTYQGASDDGVVRVEFHERTSNPADPTATALENVGQAIKAAFPSEIRSAQPTFVSDLTARCFVNVTMSSSLCQGMLGTALRVEQDLVQHLIMQELPKWVSNLTVGYEMSQIILQPTVRISTTEEQNAFGSQPSHRLRCTFQKWMQSSMTTASALFSKYSNGRCTGTAGAAYCYAFMGPKSFLQDEKLCKPSDILPARH